MSQHIPLVWMLSAADRGFLSCFDVRYALEKQSFAGDVVRKLVYLLVRAHAGGGPATSASGATDRESHGSRHGRWGKCGTEKADGNESKHRANLFTMICR